MRHFLNVIGGIAGLAAVLALLSVLLGRGTDLQLIAVGVFGTMLACCVGLAGVMERLEALRKVK
jgi:hypothetical protein